MRIRVFVDVYEHNGDLDRFDDPDNGLMARAVISGWDKSIANRRGKQLYVSIISDNLLTFSAFSDAKSVRSPGSFLRS